MNENTKDALKKACEALQDLAASCYHMAGEQTVSNTIGALETLKVALDKDDTLP
jgi:hypothetical protein